ncbi:hypothetical protein E4U21_000617 [Claviceps maximensis]|nr:hypothetical protein E4U21_000617 [Claviceps maximensis]
MAIAASQRQPRGSQNTHDNYDTYDDDEVLPQGSPLLTASRAAFTASPSPPPDIPASQVITGDCVLVQSLDNGRHPEIARAAAYQVHPSIEADEEDDYQGEVTGDVGHIISTLSGHGKRDDAFSMTSRSRDCPSESSVDTDEYSLQHLAADALKAVSRNCGPEVVSRETYDIVHNTRYLSLSDNKSTTSALPSHKVPPENSAKPDGPGKTSITRPSETESAKDQSAPIYKSRPNFESNNQKLPPIRSILERNNIPQLCTSANKGDGIVSHDSQDPSTPLSSRKLAPLRPKAVSQPSPPKSLDGADQERLTSPYSSSSSASSPDPRHTSPSASSPDPRHISRDLSQRPDINSGTSLASETHDTEHSAPESATAVSAVDSGSTDGITNPLGGRKTHDIEHSAPKRP